MFLRSYFSDTFNLEMTFFHLFFWSLGKGNFPFFIKPRFRKFYCQKSEYFRTFYRVYKMNLSFLSIKRGKTSFHSFQNSSLKELWGWWSHFIFHYETHSDQIMNFFWISRRQIFIYTLSNSSVKRRKVSASKRHFEGAHLVKKYS